MRMREASWLFGTIGQAVALTLLCFATGCQEKVEEAAIEEDVTALNERISRVFNQGDLDLVDELYAADVVRHDCGLPEDVIGLDALKSWFASHRKAFPDMIMRIDETIVKHNRIVWRWTITGTNTGPVGEMPPTGRNVRFSGVSIAGLANGKIAEIWDYYNQAALLGQLGFVINPPQEEVEE
jgi:steroid delta-isomerase-like uncharacterized protein